MERNEEKKYVGNSIHRSRERTRPQEGRILLTALDPPLFSVRICVTRAQGVSLRRVYTRFGDDGTIEVTTTTFVRVIIKSVQTRCTRYGLVFIYYFIFFFLYAVRTTMPVTLDLFSSS